MSPEYYYTNLTKYFIKICCITFLSSFFIGKKVWVNHQNLVKLDWMSCVYIYIYIYIYIYHEKRKKTKRPKETTKNSKWGLERKLSKVKKKLLQKTPENVLIMSINKILKKIINWLKGFKFCFLIIVYITLS